MTTVIRAESLGKKYVIHHEQQGQRFRYKTIGDTLAKAGKTIWHGLRGSKTGNHGQSSSEDFWALKDVSFEIQQGDRVGIIGRNGAGKSTLLKILSRITPPTTGKVNIKGRVASLLEVGTGFHPELTGRENIFLNGAILGMRKHEIKRKFDEIVDFAEVEKFLDTPVKQYSSGMYVRLAFAVAAHLEPEILVVDEVLAVGDAQFQKKCLGKMQDVSKGGRTVLFVSHNMGIITSLCSTAIMFQSGCVVHAGPVRKIVDQYLKTNAEMQKATMKLSDIHRTGDYGIKLKIERIEWLSGLPPRHGEYISLRLYFTALKDVIDVTMGLGFSTLEGIRLITFETDFQDDYYRPSLKAGTKCCVEMTVQELYLAPGVYSLDVGSRSGDSFGLDYIQDFCQIEVIMGDRTPGYIARHGAGVRMKSQWEWFSNKI